MKNQKQSLGYWIARRIKTAPAQSMVEFALALPVLLLATFGVIEFGRLMQAWLALENGARFGVRYAVTGEYNPKFCPAAYDALSAGLGLTGNNGRDDCKVEPTGANPTEAERKAARDATQDLEDWARLPSIRETAINGAAGIAYNKDVAGEDDYLAYLTDASATFSSANMGDPSEAGFVMVSICSSRDKSGTRFYTIPSSSSHKYYFSTFTDDNHMYFPSICALGNPPPVSFTDDAGGPGDTVQVSMTYRHNMITPLISEWWPSLRLNTSRKGIVEKFRTSRITGLSDTESEMGYQTETNTPTKTLTPTNTNTFTLTPTNTNTFTNTPTETFTLTPSKTNTLPPCELTGTGIRYEFANWPVPGTLPGSPLTLAPVLFGTVDTVNIYWGSASPGTGVNADYFSAKYTGFIYPLDTGDYTFRVRSNDGHVLKVNGTKLLDKWTGTSNQDFTSATVALTRCTKYPISLEIVDQTGNARAELYWKPPSGTEVIIPKKNLFPSTDPISTATITPTPTATATNTFTPTRTPTLVPCVDVGNGLRGEYFNNTSSSNPFPGNPVMVRIDPTVNFDWGSVSPNNAVIGNDYYTVRWIGEVMPLASEEYTFYTETDDGVRLYVNGTRIINGWSYSSNRRTGKITLNRCQRYTIQMELYEATGNAFARLGWTSAHQSEQIIPQVNLFGTLSGAPVVATLTPIPTNTVPPTNTPVTPSNTPVTPSNTPVTPTTKVPTTEVPPTATTKAPASLTPVPSTPTTAVPTPPSSTPITPTTPTRTPTPTPRPTTVCGGAEGC
jgi:Flp pilus assembly protein TadG